MAVTWGLLRALSLGLLSCGRCSHRDLLHSLLWPGTGDAEEDASKCLGAGDIFLGSQRKPVYYV